MYSDTATVSTENVLGLDAAIRQYEGDIKAAYKWYAIRTRGGIFSPVAPEMLTESRAKLRSLISELRQLRTKSA